MRAARVHEIGGVAQVDEIEPPAGETIEVVAAPLNPMDIAIGAGRFYGGSPEPPYVIGAEAIGRTGDGRLVWWRGPATAAERAVPGETVDVPERIEPESAAACGIAGVTGWLAVTWRAPVREDDTVLVLGASGTAGGIALQAAKFLGAKRVIGAARHLDAVPDVADEKVDVDGDLPEATLIVDALWGEPLERALTSAAQGARILHFGQSAGPTATLPSAAVRGKMIDLHGHSLFAIPHDILERGFRELCAHVAAGRITVAVQSYPLDRVAEAWERQASGSPRGKIVLIP
ncbi:MAG: zinc-binding alcohol dehydrogenase family protein [Gaiellaceae bacterium]